MFVKVLKTAGRQSYWVGLSPGKKRRTSLWVRHQPIDNIIARRSWFLHWWINEPHPLFLYRSFGVRFLGLDVELEVKAPPFPWEGRNFLVIKRFKPSARLRDALQLFFSEVIVEASGYVYLFETTYQSELVRFKEPDYMSSIFRLNRNDCRMRSYLKEYQSALVEINDPNVLKDIVFEPFVHVHVSMQNGKSRGALATSAAAVHWKNGVNQRLAGSETQARCTHGAPDQEVASSAGLRNVKDGIVHDIVRVH